MWQTVAHNPKEEQGFPCHQNTKPKSVIISGTGSAPQGSLERLKPHGQAILRGQGKGSQNGVGWIEWLIA
jgi:hypothetical protein